MSFRCRPNVVMLSYARDAGRHRVRRREGDSAADTVSPLGNASLSESAVITGRINEANGMAPTAASSIGSLTVKVAGTNVSSAVDHLGRFTLHGVPPGTVRLQIMGADVNATVTIPGVETQDQIHITVRMMALHLAECDR